MWEYFSLQLQPQLNNNFTFTEDWLDKVTNKDMLLMKEWNLPANCAYLNKLNYGFPHVLTKLKTSGDTMKVFCDIIISCI
jgi:lysozyme family protein